MNKILDAFQAVHAEDSLKSQTKNYISKELRKQKGRTRSLRLLPSLACIFLLVLSLGSWQWFMAPVSAISVDVNPSMELGINRLDRVVQVDTFNEDAQKLTKLVNIKYLPYMDALSALFNSDAMAPYLKKGALVSLSIIASNKQKSEEIYSRISSCNYEGGPRVECCFGNREEVEAAHAAGLSFGKYQVFQSLQKLDESITAEDVQGLSMRELRDWVYRLSGQESFHGKNGKGHGRNTSKKGKGSQKPNCERKCITPVP